MASIVTKKTDNTVEIDVIGQFDYQCQRDFRNAYRYEPQGVVYVINMFRTEVLDSAALGMLLLLRDHAGREAANITIKGCGENIMRIFQIASFDKLFKFV